MNKNTTVSKSYDFDKYIDSLNNRSALQIKVDNIIWWLKYGIWQKIHDIPFRTRMNYQRIKKGVSVEDIWGFNYFHTDVMIESLNYLIQYVHGCPAYLTSSDGDDDVNKGVEKWKAILKKILKTFKYAKLVQENRIFITSSEDFSTEWFNRYTEIGKQMGSRRAEWFSRPLTLKEIKEYEEGWLLFSKYYFNLWD